MAETMARVGGLGVLPQDMELDVMRRIISEVRGAHVKYDTPITVTREHTVRDALGIIHKRSHGYVVLLDDENRPITIFNERDLADRDQFTKLGTIKRPRLVTGREDISDEEAFNQMDENGVSSLPIIDKEGKLIGIMTKKHAVRNSVYSPTLDVEGKFEVAVALGVNNFIEKARILIADGIRIFVLDTAHGYQRKMIEAIQQFRKEFGDTPVVVAGNVITPEATHALIEAGADGVKVGIGPGAMCTTRMKTGVGRPQFSAVYHCALEARKLGGFVWADGGIREPRDLVLGLAAGASHVMIGTQLAGTYESTGDIKYDLDGRMYKENYGMASIRAVKQRNAGQSAFERARRELFKEGISSSKVYLRKGRESAFDLVDEFITGLRSAMTYVGARNLEEFYDKSIVGIQTAAGFKEGTPHGKIVG